MVPVLPHDQVPLVPVLPLVSMILLVPAVPVVLAVVPLVSMVPVVPLVLFVSMVHYGSLSSYSSPVSLCCYGTPFEAILQNQNHTMGTMTTGGCTQIVALVTINVFSFILHSMVHYTLK